MSQPTCDENPAAHRWIRLPPRCGEHTLGVDRHEFVASKASIEQAQELDTAGQCRLHPMGGVQAHESLGVEVQDGVVLLQDSNRKTVLEFDIDGREPNALARERLGGFLAIQDRVTVRLRQRDRSTLLVEVCIAWREPHALIFAHERHGTEEQCLGDGIQARSLDAAKVQPLSALAIRRRRLWIPDSD